RRGSRLMAATPRATTRLTAAPHRLDRAALAGVLVREFTNFRSYWRATTFSSVMEPTIYLLAFGLGFGALVAKVNGYDYVDFVAFLTGFGSASFGVLTSAVVKSIDSFSYVTSMVVTPLMLCAGSFFPIDNLPQGVQIAANFNPLYHCVQLVRDFVFGTLEL